MFPSVAAAGRRTAGQAPGSLGELPLVVVGRGAPAKVVPPLPVEADET
jgi:hypothetical protein